MNTNIKFLGVDSTKVDLTEKKDALNNAVTGYYTAEEIVAPKYKVYTALLTQSGGDDPQSLLSQNTPSLTIGVTYRITDDGGSGWDFTNVGAPNNDLNTYFIATGTTPANWGTNGYLTYNTGAPVVTVLENTIGNIWFTYADSGVYRLENETLTDSSKLYFLINQINQRSLGITWNDEDGSGAFVLTSRLTSGFYVSENGILSNTTIEIRVYE
jgi:hypothetical protein